MTATTDRGFRSGRASVGVREGTWYFEATVLRGHAQSGASKGSGGDAGNAHVRIGWGRREAGLDAPVGADGYAYGLRDVGGDKVHASRPAKYATKSGMAGFGTGDVVGCLIHIPKRSIQHPKDRESTSVEYHRKRIRLRFKGQLYLEMDEYPVSKEMEALVDRDGKYAQAKLDADLAAKVAANGGEDKMEGPMGNGVKGKKTKNAKKKAGEKKQEAMEIPPPPTFRELERIEGSRIEYFINGVSLGNAFEDIYDYLPLPPLPPPATKKSSSIPAEKEEMGDDGTLGYYPMVSCFGRGKLRMNFGPTFDYPPAEEVGARAMSERWPEYVQEERELDEKEEREMSEQLILDVEIDRLKTEALEIKLAKKAAAKAKVAGNGKKVGGVGGSPLSGNSGKGKKSGMGTPTPSISSKLNLASGPVTPRSTSPEPTSATSPIFRAMASADIGIQRSNKGHAHIDADAEGDVYVDAEGDIETDGTYPLVDRLRHDFSSAAGSSRGSPAPSTPAGYDSAAPLGTVKGKKGKGRPKAKGTGKAAAKGKSKGRAEMDGPGGAMPVDTPEEDTGFGRDVDMDMAEGVGSGSGSHLDLVGDHGAREREGEEMGTDADVDAEGEVDEEMAGGETDADAEGEMDEEYDQAQSGADLWTLQGDGHEKEEELGRTEMGGRLELG